MGFEPHQPMTLTGMLGTGANSSLALTSSHRQAELQRGCGVASCRRRGGAKAGGLIVWVI